MAGTDDVTATPGGAARDEGTRGEKGGRSPAPDAARAGDAGRGGEAAAPGAPGADREGLRAEACDDAAASVPPTDAEAAPDAEPTPDAAPAPEPAALGDGAEPGPEAVPGADPEAGSGPDDEAGRTLARPTAILAAGEPPTEVVPRLGEDGDGSSGPADRVRALLGRLPRWALPAALAVVAVAVVAVVVATQVLPPSLPDDRVLADFNAPGIAADGLTDSVYASNTGYRLEGQRVVSVEGNGADAKVATVEATFVNDSFRVTVTGTVGYELAGREWMGHGAQVTSVEAEPVAGVSGQAVVDDMDTLLAEGGSRDGVTLEGIYAGGDFDAGRSTLEGQGDGATSVIEVSARRTRSLYEYSGTITATFEFHAGRASTDAGSWELVSVTADDAAFERSRASVVGSWEGTLETTSTSNFIINAGRCWAGEGTPLSIEVTALDPDTGQMTCDLTFVSHNHGALGSDADGTEGDAVVEVTGATVLLDAETYAGTWAPPTGDRSQGAYRLEFRNEDGVWKVLVSSGVAGSDGLLPIGFTTFTDTYVLERA